MRKTHEERDAAGKLLPWVKADLRKNAPRNKALWGVGKTPSESLKPLNPAPLELAHGTFTKYQDDLPLTKEKIVDLHALSKHLPPHKRAKYPPTREARRKRRLWHWPSRGVTTTWRMLGCWHQRRLCRMPLLPTGSCPSRMGLSSPWRATQGPILAVMWIVTRAMVDDNIVNNAHIVFNLRHELS